MRLALSLTMTGLMASPAWAAGMDVSIEIPRLSVAEYHRPYVAMWLEPAAGGAATNLALWYDHDMKNNEGVKWLRDLRQWWRKSGRDLTLPVDGLTGATRAPGTHKLSFSGKGAVAKLPPGNYQLVVEAAREVGGRELLRLPLQWPPKQAETKSVKGQHELGAVSLAVKP